MSGPVVVCDLDGVIWLAEDPIKGADEGVAILRQAGAEMCFLTNNSSLTPSRYVAKLGSCGVAAMPAEVLTSAIAAAELAASRLGPGATILAVAGEGVKEALSGKGFAVVQEGPCDAVVVGWHREFDFEAMSRATAAVLGGAWLIATNDDPTYPVPGGVVPGNGALVASVATATGQAPTVAGKPNAATVDMLARRYGAGSQRGVVIGDRPTTDGRLASALSWPFALVLSKVSRSSEAERAAAGSAALVGDSLREIAHEVVGLWRH